MSLLPSLPPSLPRDRRCAETNSDGKYIGMRLSRGYVGYRAQLPDAKVVEGLLGGGKG